MHGYCAAIARRLQAFHCDSLPPSSKSFCLPSAARKAGFSPLPPSPSSSSRSSPSMYRFSVQELPSYRFTVQEPPSYCIQNGFHSPQKGLSSIAAHAPLFAKPGHLSRRRLDLGSPFLRNAPSCSLRLRDCASLSHSSLSSLPEESKLLSPSTKCEEGTKGAVEVFTNSEEHTELAAEFAEPNNLRKSQAETFSLGEYAQAEACCEEDAASSVCPSVSEACSVEDEASSISYEDLEEKLSAGRCSRKLSLDAIASRARSRVERRRRGATFARNIQNNMPDLLAVPGIGPRNFEKLVAKGIGKVAELKQLYRDKFLNDESNKMVEFLQSSVGIVHKNHAESITSYVKNCVDEEQKEQSSLDKENNIRQKKKVTICVEGNISVGKTTFLKKIANEIIELRDLVEIVPEPVDKWKDVGPDHFNLLDAFYNEPERYAYTFQNYVFATRLMKEQETSKGMKPLRLMERSIFSDRLVFVRAVHEAKWMSELELRIYESWFDPFISALPGLVPDGFIYLRASPDTCLQRLHMRNRPEERSVTLEYLRGLHEKHEQCFFPSENPGGIYSLNRLPSGPHRAPPPPRIRDRVFYLEGDHLHSSIRKVPALILDCEASIDFNRDLEARAEYAHQVAEFYEYIRSNKDVDMNETASSGTISPFLLPYTGGLLKPDGSPFLHGHDLDAFNFGRRSSAFVT